MTTVQVKELGQVTWNCSCPVYDVQKVFDVYWMMAVNDSSIPSHYERYLHTLYNQTHPMNLTLSGVAASIYLSVSFVCCTFLNLHKKSFCTVEFAHGHIHLTFSSLNDFAEVLFSLLIFRVIQ